MAKHLSMIVLYLLGTTITALGIVLIINANLGVSPWDVLHIAVATISPLTIGQAIQVVSLFLTLLIIIGRRHIRFIAMAIPFIIVGNLVDLFNIYLLSDFDPQGFMRLIIFLIGLLVIPFGSALMIITPYPAGIYDELMLLMMHIFKTTKMGYMRIALELIPMSLGVSITLIARQSFGALHIGTLIFILLMGPMIQIYLNMLRRHKHGNQQINRPHILKTNRHKSRH